MKRHIPPLATEGARLRLLEERDLALTRAWRNQDQIRRWFLTSDPITPQQHQEWFGRYKDRDDDFVFVIEETEVLKRPVGQVSLYHVDWLSGRAEYGRLMIGEEQARGRGLARRATTLLIDHAFGSMGLRELYLECLNDNHRALAVYADCGFEVVGQRGPVTLMTIQRGDTVGR
jgi:RimJ/RimL family protein N-acetyltransferase